MPKTQITISSQDGKPFNQLAKLIHEQDVKRAKGLKQTYAMRQANKARAAAKKGAR